MLKETQSWPHYWTEGEKARGDAAVLAFVDDVSDHRAECPVCQQKQPCKELQAMIDGVAKITKAIGAESFANWTAHLEKTYPPLLPPGWRNK